MIRYAITLIGYGLALVAIGFVTYSAAPESANAKTAVFISGGIAAACVACALLSLMISANRKLGMIGIHVGLVLPLITISGPAMRLPGSLDATAKGNQDLENVAQLIEQSGTGTIGPAEEGEWEITFPASQTRVGLTALLEPRGYQAVGIASTAALSAFAFVALLVHRPKVPPKPARDAN